MIYPSAPMSSRNQVGKSFLDAILALAVIFFLVLTLYGNSTADADSVREVVQMASEDPSAQAALKKGLAEYPAPTNWELSQIRKEVNAALVSAEVRALAPESSRKSESSIP